MKEIPPWPWYASDERAAVDTESITAAVRSMASWPTVLLGVTLVGNPARLLEKL